MRFVIPLLALLLISCGGSSRPDPDSPVQDVEQRFEPNYRVIAADSELTFTATQEGQPFTGAFTEFDATIYFMAEDRSQSRVHVTIPLASFDAENADRNSTAPASAWFNAKAFPIATFEADTIREDESSYVADGALTIKGITQPLSLPFSLETETHESGVERTIMRSQLSLDRTRWNVGESPWDTEEYVGHAVTLEILLHAEKLN